MPPRLRQLEIRGFRAFGTELQRLEFGGPLAIVHAPNSQGKSGIAEAVEFLFTGTGSRRELLGGAKVEYDACLRNVHLASGEAAWVAAGIETDDGVVHQVRRTLDSDYGARGEDCRSTLVIDGAPAESLASLGYHLSEPPLQAPVLLQHTLRYVLSAQPQERADYFKAVLEVADLEIVRKEVGRLTVGLDGTSPDPTLIRLQELAAAGGFQGWDQRLRRDALSSAGPTESLAEATGIALSQAGSAFPADLDLAGRTALLADAVERRRAAVFPLRDLGAGIAQPDQKVDLTALTTYNEAMAQVDADSIRLAAIFTAVLALPRVAQATAALDCPVCETAGALTSARRAALREQASRSESVQVTVRNAVTTVSAARRYALSAGTAAKALPTAARWGDDDVARRRATLVALGDFGQLYDTAILAVRATAAAAGKLSEAATALTTTIGEAEQKLRQRMTFPTAQLDAANNTVSGAWQALQTALTAHKTAVDALTVPVRPVLDRNLGGTGWVALLSLAATPDSLVAAVRREHAQTVVRQRLTGAEKSIETAIANVLDKRFSAMSGEVLRWWKTLRPDELVGFSGVQRRGTGKRFLDLKATLRPHLGGTPVSRDAIGIYSDSQLNALGLSAFLARSLIERCPLILLDDPIPNSDLEHRATFAMRTVPELLDTGIQLLITTFDPTLADLIRKLHGHRGMDEFEVSLDDPPQGTVVVKRSDEFEWMMAKAKSQLRVGLEASRRTVAQDLRTAAERLAKLVIMAGRQKEGHPCLLTDFADKTLGELTADVVAYAKTTDEPGRWRVLGNSSTPEPTMRRPHRPANWSRCTGNSAT